MSNDYWHAKQKQDLLIITLKKMSIFPRRVASFHRKIKTAIIAKSCSLFINRCSTCLQFFAFFSQITVIDVTFGALVQKQS